MSNDKKHVWKDYFESRIYGDYSKSHKDILKLIDKELMIKFPNEYPYIHFNWADISELYNECSYEYYGQKSESKKTYNDGKLVADDMMDSMLSLSISEHEEAHYGYCENKFPYHKKQEENYIDMYCSEDINSTIKLYEYMNALFNLFRSIEFDIIQWNKDKDCVFVRLTDGRSTVVKRYGDTKDDIYAAVAYALAKIEFETNSNFKKEVARCLVNLDSKKGKKNGK